MKAHNFNVRNAVELRSGSRTLDLRGDYLFESAFYDATNAAVSLHWRSTRLGPREDLVLYFEGVKRFQVDSTSAIGASEIEPSDTGSLNCIGFIRDDPSASWPVIMDEPPPEEWAWRFEFDSGCTYLIDAYTVRLEIASRERSAIN
ncbi:MAG: hypothetical protein AAF493_15255 [Pseudomonadota bacterium]